MRIGNETIQREIATAFEDGLHRQYGPVRGALYGEVARYRAGASLAHEELRHDLDATALPVLEALVRNQVKDSTLLIIRSLMIGAALSNDREAVIRWATVGLDRAPQLGADWAATEPQWQCVLADPAQFIFYSRQIKSYLNQIEP